MLEILQIPAVDVTLGLASAVLLLLAAYLLARSRSEYAPYHRTRPVDLDPPGLFKEVGLPGTESRLSFVASLFLHILAVALVPWLDLASSWRPALPNPQHEIITLDYRMPLPPVLSYPEMWQEDLDPEKRDAEHDDVDKTGDEPVTTGQDEGSISGPDNQAAPGPDPVKADSGGPKPPEAPPELSQPSESEPVDRDETVRMFSPDLQTGDAVVSDIVLQPDFTVELPPEVELSLPPVLLWVNEPPTLEALAILEPTPEDPNELVRENFPTVEPLVLTPNDETRLSSLQMRQLTLENDDPALTVPPGDVAPLAGREEVEEPGKTPSITGEEGRNSLVALSERPDMDSTTFELAPGLRLGSLEQLVPQIPSELLASSGEGGESGELDESPASPAVSNEEGNPSAGDFLIGEGFTEVDLAEHGEGQEGDGEGVSPGERKDSGGLLTVVSENRGGAKIIQITGTSGKGEKGSGPGAGGDPSGDESAKGLRPLPRSKYGIILVSNSRNTLPEAVGVLTGSPVYTVHFHVPEAPRKWILQYCLPQSEPEEIDTSSGVIKIRSSKRVDPPYALSRRPLRLAKPSEETRHGSPRRVVVYALVNESGVLERSRVIRGSDPATDQMILAELRSWDFLPAFQEGEPVSVEAVFGVPLQ